MDEIILRVRKVAKGKAEGEALVSCQPLSFWGGVNTETGVVSDKHHELDGVSMTGKILVFPVSKGSSGGSYQLLKMVSHKTEPKGIINLRADPVLAVGAIISNIPMVIGLDDNPLELIKTGDHVELDADNGIVKVRRRSLIT